MTSSGQLWLDRTEQINSQVHRRPSRRKDTKFQLDTLPPLRKILSVIYDIILSKWQNWLSNLTNSQDLGEKLE